jgi:hypothetical protein
MSATFRFSKRSCFVVENEAGLEEIFTPLSSPFTYPKTILNMKLFSESIRSFWEGFASFYTNIYHGMKGW